MRQAGSAPRRHRLCSFSKHGRRGHRRQRSPQQKPIRMDPSHEAAHRLTSNHCRSAVRYVENPVANTTMRQTGVFGTYYSDSRQQFKCRENQDLSDMIAFPFLRCQLLISGRAYREQILKNDLAEIGVPAPRPVRLSRSLSVFGKGRVQWQLCRAGAGFKQHWGWQVQPNHCVAGSGGHLAFLYEQWRGRLPKLPLGLPEKRPGPKVRLGKAICLRTPEKSIGSFDQVCAGRQTPAQVR